ncbi:hypothetical protein J7F03_14300 [Streptomyces sp. ISL-43]|uniref:DUF6479 family protein n=1 Tax=Streptomyces sp. ISL-43 TaxID=2819183 RepID=UPI001BED3743|nr:DUF6479 family protein [Streptomyces sp. ISL-43]MBT2448232.1 hypothetical protein [Streptomyces sp. ISL-43]
MDTTLTYIALDSTLTDIAWFLVVGLIVVGFLLGGFMLGKRVRAQEPAPPTPESQPHLPDGGAVYEVSEEREYVEIPEGGLRPHEMQGYGNFGSRTSSHQEEDRAERESGYEHPNPRPGQPPAAPPVGGAKPA